MRFHFSHFAAALCVLPVAAPVAAQAIYPLHRAEIMAGAGVPDFVVPILVEIQKSIRVGSLDVASNDFKKLLGHPATPINEALRQIVDGLKQNS